jgi:hypothetical protein
MYSRLLATTMIAAAVATHRLLDLLLLIMVALGITNVFAHGFPLFNLWHFPKFGGNEFMRSINAWRIDRKCNYHRSTVSFRGRAFPSPCDQGRGFARDVADPAWSCEQTLKRKATRPPCWRKAVGDIQTLDLASCGWLDLAQTSP